jgi:predicted outer membrane repeat protein
LALCRIGLADELHVPSGYGTIQSAIDDANNGDVVVVADGTYTGPGNRDIDFLGKAITVRSTDPNDPNIVAATIIDCNGTEADPHRGFYFDNGEDANSVLEGFTITNGYADGHGGGALFLKSASPTITNCVFIGNIGDVQAGALYCRTDSSPILTGCTFSENSAGRSGGAITSRQASPTLINCILSDNHAMGGGAIDNMCTSTTLTNCTFAGNWATYGNALACESSPYANCSSNVQLTNCILWDGGNEIWNNDESTIVIKYSDVQGGWPGLGNIDVDPCFADPCNGDYHLRSTAGRWEPDSESWLLDCCTSPCIDAGNPGCLLGKEPDPNGNRINIGAYGGAAEASKSPPDWALLADLTNDRKVDSNDLRVFVSYWLETGQCIPSDLDRDQLVDFPDFAVFGQKTWRAGQIANTRR